MAYKIYHSNSLASFINSYSDIFHSDSLFGDRVITVVQNRNIASWLKLELTKLDGISMDLHLEYPENAVKQLVLGYESGQGLFGSEEDKKSILFMDSLKIVVYKTLEELLIDDREFPNLFNYVAGSPKKLFQLSDSIAGLFYHYGMNCPLMVASWDRGELYKNSKENVLRAEDQKWQMALWRYIFNIDSPYLHISNILNTVLNSNEHYSPTLSPFGNCKIILFGSSFLGESAIKFFNYLSRDIEINHFILTPSEIYSKDAESVPLSLLNKFSGLINGFTSISREPGFNKSRISFLKEYNEDTLLSKLKNGIKNNSLIEEQSERRLSVGDGDNSIKICKVTGGWREIEILKDKILHLLSKDSELKLTDIGVVAPEIGDYSSYIEGVFPDRTQASDGTVIYGKSDLPYNIMGLKGGEESPYIRGILSLLDLPGGDFNRRDIIGLISNPCFMERFSITVSTKDLFIETIDALNIKWGVDCDHRKDLGYASEEFNTWESGFRRFLLGIALNREDDSTIPYNMNDSQGVESIGNLVHIIRSLYSDLWSLNSLKLKMDEWVLFIETIMETYLKPVKDDIFDERERLSVKNQYRNILNLLDDLKELSNFKRKEIPFAVFKSLLKEFIVKSGNSRGRYLTQGITFSSLKPLRAVPFKHIFVLGLNENVFPGKEKIPSYDLRGIYDQKIDLSKRQNDKFAFLELILSAEKSLTIFYNAKDQISGEELQPSVVISELLEAIELNFDQVNIIEEHPLHNFDPKYFVSSSSICTYNRMAYESALAYTGNKRPESKICLDKDSLDKREIEVTVKELIQFIKNPVKTFFNEGEGIFLDSKKSVEEDVFENRELDFISKWKFANIALEQGLLEDAAFEDLTERFFEIAEKEGVLKVSNLTNNIRLEIDELISSMDQFLIEKNLKGTSFKRVTRELDGEYSPLKFEIDGVDVTLTGELENLWVNDETCFTAGITFGRDNQMKVKDRIIPFIYSKIIYSHPEMNENLLTAFSVGKTDVEPVEFPRKEESMDTLKDLLSLYIKNLKSPIPLFPEVMEGSDVDGVKSLWEKSLANSRSYSLIKECPYINMAYSGETPEFDQNDTELLFNTLYKEISLKRAKK